MVFFSAFDGVSCIHRGVRVIFIIRFLISLHGRTSSTHIIKICQNEARD
jgi:hypothetical protein